MLTISTSHISATIADQQRDPALAGLGRGVPGSEAWARGWSRSWAQVSTCRRPPDAALQLCIPSTSAATASATSARSRSDGASTNSSGRVGAAAAGPEPVDGERDRRGEVAGVAGAAARDADDRAAEPSRRRARAAARSPRACPSPATRRSIVASSADAVDARPGTAASTSRTPRSDRRACRTSARPRPGRRSTRRPSASPSGPRSGARGRAGRGGAATSIAAPASASSALRPWSGALPECEARPVATHPQRAGGLAADDHALVAVRGELAGLEAQARVVAGEPLDVHERRAGATPRR